MNTKTLKLHPIMFTNYLRTSFRNLYKHGANTIINILGLALGIGCCLVVYILISYETSFDHQHSNSDRIYRVNTKVAYEQGGVRSFARTPYPIAEAIQLDYGTAESSPLEMVTQVHGIDGSTILIPQADGTMTRFQQPDIMYADNNYFKVFDFGTDDLWIKGDVESALSEPYSVVLTQTIAEKFFNATDVVGKTFLLDKTIEVTVKGVIQDIPQNTGTPFKMLVSYSTFKILNKKAHETWGSISDGMAYLLFKDGVNPKDFEDELLEVENKYYGDDTKNRVFFDLIALKEAHTDTEYGDGLHYVAPLEILGGFGIMGIFVLLTACINFINLATAQSTKRAKEIGIRKVLGSYRRQIITQFLSETALVTILGTIIALWIAELFIHEFNAFLSVIDYNLELTWGVMPFLILLVAIVTFIAGIYPALILSGYQPIAVLKQNLNSKKKKGGMTLRRILVITQFVISQLLIISTIVVAVQIKYFNEKDLGFDKEAILMAYCSEKLTPKLEQIKHGLSQSPSITDLSFGANPPLSSNASSSTFYIKGYNDEKSANSIMRRIDENYLDLFKLKLVAGRNVNEQDTFNHILVNEALVKKIGITDPQEAIGVELIFGSSDKVMPSIIVGVVGDFHYTSMKSTIQPMTLYRDPNRYNRTFIKIRPEADLAQTLSFLENEYKKIFPEEYVHVEAYEDHIADLYIVENLLFNAFKVFSFIAIFVGCLGLYGLVSFMAIQKKKEVGVRKVLGATRVEILGLFSKEFMRLVLIAFVFAAPLAYLAMDAWLSGFVYKIEMSILFFLSGIFISSAIALLTVGYEAIKAATVNPTKSLRYE